MTVPLTHDISVKIETAANIHSHMSRGASRYLKAWCVFTWSDYGTMYAPTLYAPFNIFYLACFLIFSCNLVFCILRRSSEAPTWWTVRSWQEASVPEGKGTGLWKFVNIELFILVCFYRKSGIYCSFWSNSNSKMSRAVTFKPVIMVWLLSHPLLYFQTSIAWKDQLVSFWVLHKIPVKLIKY